MLSLWLFNDAENIHFFRFLWIWVFSTIIPYFHHANFNVHGYIFPVVLILLSEEITEIKQIIFITIYLNNHCINTHCSKMFRLFPEKFSRNTNLKKSYIIISIPITDNNHLKSFLDVDCILLKVFTPQYAIMFQVS